MYIYIYVNPAYTLVWNPCSDSRSVMHAVVLRYELQLADPLVSTRKRFDELILRLLSRRSELARCCLGALQNLFRSAIAFLEVRVCFQKLRLQHLWNLSSYNGM